ncbi:MAG: hypothetical protein MJB57_17335 [Gemmatimonadetes bacterium]|nr:hypothetical protein [Gemmatimonadota bacterium]
MSPNDRMGGGGVEGRKKTYDIQRLTPRWLKTVKEANRLEFEREMQRHRARFANELNRYWRRHRPAS